METINILSVNSQGLGDWNKRNTTPSPNPLSICLCTFCSINTIYYYISLYTGLFSMNNMCGQITYTSLSVVYIWAYNDSGANHFTGIRP